MSHEIYRYHFGETVPIADVKDSLLLAAFSAEGIHGATQVQLDARFRLEEERRACVIDASTPVGRTIAQVFSSFLVHEFGEGAFTVERVIETPMAGPAPAMEAVR